MNLQFIFENLSSSQIFFVLLVIIVAISLFIFSIRPLQTPNYIEEGRTDIFTNKTKKKLRKNESVPDNGSKTIIIPKDKKKNVTKNSDLRKRIDRSELNSEKPSSKQPQSLPLDEDLYSPCIRTVLEKGKASKPAENQEENSGDWTEVLSPKERQKRSRQLVVEPPIVTKQELKSPPIKNENETISGKVNSPTKTQDKKSTKKSKKDQTVVPTELPVDISISKESSSECQEKPNSLVAEADPMPIRTPELSSTDKPAKKLSQKKKEPAIKTAGAFEIAAFSIPTAIPIESSTASQAKEEEEDEVVAHLVSLKQKQAANRQKESSSSSDSLIEGFEVVEKSCIKDEEEELTPSPSSGASRRKNKKEKKKDSSYAATVSKPSDETKNVNISNEALPAADLDTQDWCQVTETKKKKKPRRVD